MSEWQRVGIAVALGAVLMTGCESPTAHVVDAKASIDQQFVGIQSQMADLETTMEKREEFDITHGFRLAMENTSATNKQKRQILLDAINEIRVRHHLQPCKSFEEWVASNE